MISASQWVNQTMPCELFRGKLRKKRAVPSPRVALSGIILMPVDTITQVRWLLVPGKTS